MPCPFYGKHLVRESGILMDQHGNQCALITEALSPCRMETAGQEVDFEKCELFGTERHQSALALISIQGSAGTRSTVARALARQLFKLSALIAAGEESDLPQIAEQLRNVADALNELAALMKHQGNGGGTK